MAASRTDLLLKVKDKYIAAGHSEPYTISELAMWAINNGEWQPDQTRLLKMCKEEMRRALQSQVHQTPSGAVVRTNVSARRPVIIDGTPEQKHLWADIRTAPHEFVLAAVTDMRKAIRADVDALRSQIEEYNAHYLPANRDPIQADFNFDDEEDEETGAA